MIEAVRTACSSVEADSSAPDQSVPGGPSRTAPEGQPATRSVPFYTRFLWRHEVLHGFWLELRSFYQRIRLLCKRGRIPQCSIGKGWLKYGDQRLIWNTTSEGRILGIKKLHSVRPWASQEDRLLFLAGWELGRLWGVRTVGHPGEEPIECALSSEYLRELAGDSGADFTSCG